MEEDEKLRKEAEGDNDEVRNIMKMKEKREIKEKCNNSKKLCG